MVTGGIEEWGVSIFSRRNQLSKTVNHLVHLLPSAFQFWKFKMPKLYVIDQISVYFTWFISAFLSFIKLVQSMEGAPIFLGGTNSVKRLIYVVFSSLIQLWICQVSKFYCFHKVSTYFTWFSSSFLSFSKRMSAYFLPRNQFCNKLFVPRIFISFTKKWRA